MAWTTLDIETAVGDNPSLAVACNQHDVIVVFCTGGTVSDSDSNAYQILGPLPVSSASATARYAFAAATNAALTISAVGTGLALTALVYHPDATGHFVGSRSRSMAMPITGGNLGPVTLPGYANDLIVVGVWRELAAGGYASPNFGESGFTDADTNVAGSGVDQFTDQKLAGSANPVVSIAFDADGAGIPGPDAQAGLIALVFTENPVMPPPPPDPPSVPPDTNCECKITKPKGYNGPWPPQRRNRYGSPGRMAPYGPQYPHLRRGGGVEDVLTLLRALDPDLYWRLFVAGPLSGPGYSPLAPTKGANGQPIAVGVMPGWAGPPQFSQAEMAQLLAKGYTAEEIVLGLLMENAHDIGSAGDLTQAEKYIAALDQELKSQGGYQKLKDLLASYSAAEEALLKAGAPLANTPCEFEGVNYPYTGYKERLDVGLFELKPNLKQYPDAEYQKLIEDWKNAQKALDRFFSNNPGSRSAFFSRDRYKRLEGPKRSDPPGTGPRWGELYVPPTPPTSGGGGISANDFLNSSANTSRVPPGPGSAMYPVTASGHLTGGPGSGFASLMGLPVFNGSGVTGSCVVQGGATLDSGSGAVGKGLPGGMGSPMSAPGMAGGGLAAAGGGLGSLQRVNGRTNGGTGEFA